MGARDDRSHQALQWRRLYKTARWARIRERQLQRQPLCLPCLDRGLIVRATVCNHLDPRSKATEAGFFKGPFSSLCKACHDAGEQRVEGLGYSGEADGDGWPIDPRHPANHQRTTT